MGKTNSVRVRRGLVIYKQQHSLNWHARIYMDVGGKGVHTLSTRTPVQRDAVEKAHDFYADFRRWQRGETAIPPYLVKREESKRRFDKIVDQWIDELTLEAGTDPKRLRDVRDKRSVCYSPNGMCAFFGKDDIDKITTDRIKEMLRFTEEHSKKERLASSTMKRILVVLGLILKFGVGKGLLTTLPVMPKVKQVDQPRAWFNHTELAKLIAKAEELATAAEQRGEKAEADLWWEIADFIVFMVSTFLRSSEWADLRNQHVELLKERTPSLKIAVAKGKTKPRYTVSMPEAVSVYQRILKRNGRKPDAYLFLNAFSNRQTASERMYDRFEILLKATNLKKNSLGQTRVIHSLRHTALMFRLLEGVSHFTLAKNAGTSVDQLERFYCSHHSAEMGLGELHKGVRLPEKRRAAVRPLKVASNRNFSPHPSAARVSQPREGTAHE